MKKLLFIIFGLLFFITIFSTIYTLDSGFYKYSSTFFKTNNSYQTIKTVNEFFYKEFKPVNNCIKNTSKNFKNNIDKVINKNSRNAMLFIGMSFIFGLGNSLAHAKGKLITTCFFLSERQPVKHALKFGINTYIFYLISFIFYSISIKNSVGKSYYYFATLTSSSILLISGIVLLFKNNLKNNKYNLNNLVLYLVPFGLAILPITNNFFEFGVMFYGSIWYVWIFFIIFSGLGIATTLALVASLTILFNKAHDKSYSHIGKYTTISVIQFLSGITIIILSVYMLLMNF